MPMSLHPRAVGFTTLLLASACGGSVLLGTEADRVGGNGSTQGSSGSTPGPLDAFSGGASGDGAASASASDAGGSEASICPAFAGAAASGGQTYIGYLENYMLLSGSDAASLTLSIAADGTVTGQVLFGGLPLLTPPTNPNVSYPPSGNYNVYPGSYQGDVYEHFNFSLEKGTFDPVLDRLRFSVDTNEIFAQWCELQTSDICDWDNEGTSEAGVCTVGNSMTGQTRVISDCSEYYLCSIFHPCDCSANHCCEIPTTSPLSFDMQVSGTHIDGSVVGLGNDPINIHFVQSPASGDASTPDSRASVGVDDSGPD
jgi:hypothetical protein